MVGLQVPVPINIPCICKAVQQQQPILVVTWCSSLGGVPGVPKVHFKGRQGEYYIMVRLPPNPMQAAHSILA